MPGVLREVCDWGWGNRAGEVERRLSLRGLRCLRLVEVPPDGFGGFARNYCGQGIGGGLLHVAQAAEVGEQALACLLSDAGNIQQL